MNKLEKSVMKNQRCHLLAETGGFMCTLKLDLHRTTGNFGVTSAVAMTSRVCLPDAV